MDRVRTSVLFAVFGFGVLWAASPADALAQETGAVRGRVVDASTQQPLAQAQVFVPGTDIGTLTADDGTYRLGGLPTGPTTLRVRMIGYTRTSRTVRVRAGQTTEVNFQLETQALSMEEIVVTTTGERRRVEIGNAIATVQSDEIDQSPTMSLSQVLTGRAPGVQILKSGGTTGTGSRIRIRGSTSVSLSNEPLVYVDGVRINNDPQSISFETGGQAPSRINDIPLNQIASIEIVKGPSAATLYGTKAASGVIRIRTKRGVEGGGTRANLSIRQGATWEPNEYPANFRGFDADGNPCLLVQVAAGECTQATVRSFSPLDHDHTMPWRSGQLQKYRGSVRGGTGDLGYYVSGAYQDNEGVMPVNSVVEANARANLNATITEELSFRLNTGFISNDIALPNNDNFALGVITNGLGGFWTDEMLNGYGEFTPETLFTVDSRQEVDRFLGGFSPTWNPVDFLRVNGTVGVDFINRVDTQFFPTGKAPAFLGFQNGARFVNQFRSWNWTVDFTASASADISDEIGSETTAGFQWFKDRTTGTFAEGRGLPRGVRSIGAAATRVSDEQTTVSKTVGVFVEERISVRDRLFLTGAIRGDDNSAFGAQFDVVFLPKASVSWLAVQEGNGLLNSLRLRGAWGKSALQPGTTDAVTFFDPIPATVGGQSVTAVTVGGLGNPQLEPEKASEFEAGFDAVLLDSRLNLGFTAFLKETEDALVFRQLPPSLGSASGRFENLGSVENRGLEAQVTGRLLEGENVDWRVSFNGAITDNELEELGEGIPPIIFGTQGQQRHREDFPLGGYWAPPIESFSDANGDGLIGVNEVTLGETAEFLGRPFPVQTATVQSQLSLFDRLHVRGMLAFEGGHKLFNFTRAWRLGLNIDRYQSDPSTSLANQARAVASKFLGTDAGYVEDASFWRLRELSATYDLPNRWLSLLGARSASITVAGRNLGLWTDYTGLDPELSQTGQSNFLQLEFMTQPPVRRFTATLDVSF